MAKNYAKILVSLLISAFMLTSCMEGNKKGAGTAIGALAGGMLGSTMGKGSGQLVGVGVGAILGGYLGNQIGATMDEQDKMAMERASQHALEYQASGQSTAWKNPDSGHSGQFTPVRTFNKNGRYCREFSQTVNIGGEQEKAYGIACRQPDGQWQIIQE